MIEEMKLNAPTMIDRLLFLLRSTSHGNAFVSTYGTNFEYINPWYDRSSVAFYTESVMYDNDCSCGLNSSCTTQAAFIQRDSTVFLIIKGLKMGCTPSESFLASTLECFYDFLCIDLIYEMVNYSSNINPPNPLNLINSQFPMNITVGDLVKNLFIENWLTILNYSSYFDQCSPMLCSYTYVKQVDPFYAINFLLGLCGGLSVILKWICPNIVYIIAKIYQSRKKRTNFIAPISTIQITNNNIKSDQRNTHDDPSQLEATSADSTHPYSFFYFLKVIICI